MRKVVAAFSERVDADASANADLSSVVSARTVGSMTIPALEPERYEELCRLVSIYLKPVDALDVLELIALATPPITPIPPIDKAVHRLEDILDVVIGEEGPIPFDQEKM